METRLIEARSFDHVPETERHGTLGNQLAFWFMINANILTLYAGTVGPAAGLDLPWSLVAICVGSLFGTLFQAFHGAQGPRLGLPQVIQSRAQFGSRGVLVPIVAAIFIPFGFAVFLLRTAASAVVDVTGAIQPEMPRLAVALLAGVLAIFGFRLVMKVQRWVAAITLVNLMILTFVAASLPFGEMLGRGAFTWTAFLAQFSTSAIYQLAVAPIVSDYTRYLPKGIGGGKVSATVFVGTLASAIWLEALGASLIMTWPTADVITSLQSMTSRFGHGLRPMTMAVAALGCLTSAAVLVYSGSITLISGLEPFGKLRPTVTLRMSVIGVGMAFVLWGVLAMPEDIQQAFQLVLGLMGYVLIPWTAVNLTDDYLVRKGAYSITDILDPDGGTYGRWGAKGLSAYLAGLVAMIPFIPGLGPFTNTTTGLELCFGLGVSGLTYASLMRNHDHATERARIRRAPIHTLDGD